MTDTLAITENVAPATELSGARWRARVIGVGWGSSGFYSSELLEKDGARAFHAGLQIHADHPTEEELYNRPERSINTLIGKLTSDALFEADGPEGPGLYADIEFFDSFVSRARELHRDVGLSINADGETELAERDGRYGPVVRSITLAKSVDVVTRPGAGGKLVRMIESDRGLAGRPIHTKENQHMADVTAEDFASLREEIGRLPALFVDAMKGAGFAPAPVVADDAAGDLTTTATSSVTDTEAIAASTAGHEVVAEAAPEVVLDHGLIIESLRAQSLPGAVAGAVVADVKAGKSVEEAVAAQVALREAFVAEAGERGTVTLRESDAKATGLARSVSELRK